MTFDIEYGRADSQTQGGWVDVVHVNGAKKLRAAIIEIRSSSANWFEISRRGAGLCGMQKRDGKWWFR